MDFVPCQAGAGTVLDAVVVFDPEGKPDDRPGLRGVPAYVAADNPAQRVARHSWELKFGSNPILDPCLRAQVMEDCELREFLPLAPMAGDETLASSGGEPFWILRRNADGSVHRVGALPLPVREDEYLWEYFRAGCFMRVLPLIVFLRQLTRENDWQYARRQACFVVDDPSLYWPSYGYLNFQRLAEHTRAHDYFVSIATIPLDTWWLNPRVLAIFRANAPRLSLLAHGNDHLQQELASPRSAEQTSRFLAQALRRFERLERCDGLEVCRVMEAPHGAFAKTSLESLRRLGFEGVLATADLLVRYNPEVRWFSTLGLDAVDLLAEVGLPGIPRIMMTKDWKSRVLLAGILDQPLVLAGHHADAADGMELMAEYAHLVQSIGGVTWATPAGILRSNYKQLRRGRALHVRLCSRRIHLTIPDGVEELWVHRPWLAPGDEAGDLTVHCGHEQRIAAQPASGGLGGPYPVKQSDNLVVACSLKDGVDFKTMAPPPSSLYPILRKVLVEARDRCSPIFGWKNRYVVPQLPNARRDPRPEPDGRRRSRD